MSTNSFIGKFENDSIETIYCHWNGFVSGVGVTLQQHYNSKQAVEKLLTLNGISSLKNTFEETKEETYDNRNSLKRVDTPKDFLALLKKNLFIEYFYLFADGKWKVLDFYEHRVKIKSAQNFKSVWELFEDLEPLC